MKRQSSDTRHAVGSQTAPKERITNQMKAKTKKIGGLVGVGVVVMAIIAAVLIRNSSNQPQYATVKESVTEIPAIATPSAAYAEIKTADGDKTVTDSAGFNELLTFVEGVEINTKEVKKGSWDSSEAANKITFYRADNSMDSVISFTADCSKIWIETNATVSYTYTTKDPLEVRKGLAAFLDTDN